jgi:phage/plasmid-like protein (TIGR03299 family)
MHEFDSGFYGGRQPAWHGLGNVISDDVVTAQQALTLGGLDWTVEKIPLVGLLTLPTGEEVEIDVPSHMATVRLDRVEQGPLGVVGNDAYVLQNEELLDFCELLQDTDEAIFHTAGSLRGGRIVWALCRLSKGVKIAGMEDEAIDPFLAMVNAHDGSRALTGVVTPVRVVCMNTVNLAISRAVRAWKVRHTPGMKFKLNDAREALGIAFTYMAQFEETGNQLVRAKMTKADFAQFLENLIPYTPEMAASVGVGNPSRAARNVDEARQMVQTLYETSPNLENIRRTKWAAVNAVAEYVDFAKPERNMFKADGVTLDSRGMEERRFVKIAIDNQLKQRALRLLEPKLAHGKGDNLEMFASNVFS